MCSDSEGNIALAYTVVSETQFPSLRYTGRFSTDPLNVMTIEEEIFINGTQSDPSFRYGDYAQMTIDPVDDKTFWSIGEYFTGGTRKNLVGVFKIAPDLSQDVGIVSIDSPTNGILSDAESITVTIRNFGVASQNSIPVSFQINGGEVISEVFSGSLSSNTNIQFTFSATGDFSEQGLTYQIFAATGLTVDQNLENDTVSASVSHLYGDDIGVISITSPVSGSYLTEEETVSITLQNFGAFDQTGFDVSYSVNGAEPVTETISGPLNSESTLDYTFNDKVDLSVIGFYDLTVSTSLPGDANVANDAYTVTIYNSLCQPELMCTQGVGVFDFQLGTISNYSGCDPNGYGNYTSLSTDLAQGSANNLTITTGYGSVYVKVWIDFNDNFDFEPDEIVVNDYVIAPGQQTGTYIETMPLVIPDNVALGEHMLRVKANYNASVPIDPCASTMFGETEDYIVNITLGTGTGIQRYEPNDLVLINKGNNQFVATFEAADITETLFISIHNIRGQKVIFNRVLNINGKYEYEFDMSYAPAGIYLLRLGTENFGKVERFVVQ